jgi:hypothetical protein
VYLEHQLVVITLLNPLGNVREPGLQEVGGVRRAPVLEHGDVDVVVTTARRPAGHADYLTRCHLVTTNITTVDTYSVNPMYVLIGVCLVYGSTS